MRRRLLIVAVFLVAGAVVNVAVAWGCAARTIRVRGGAALLLFRLEITTSGGLPQFRIPGLPTYLADPDWLSESDWKLGPIDDDFVWKPVGRDEISGFGFERKGFYLLYPHVPSGPRGALSVASFVVRDRSGWPLRALQEELWLLELEDRELEGRVISWERRMIKDDWLLAYLPIWPGFAVNTLFYAGILWLLLPGPFVLWRFIRRRLIRLRRGLCPKCAYPMGESSVCSECGNKLPKRVRPAT